MTEIMDIDTEPVIPAQTTAPGTEPTDWMSPTGEIREGAPEAVANLVKSKGWNTVEKLVEGFVGLEKFKGIGKHLVIPEPEDAEGWENVYKELGRPETHDKYEFSTESKIPLSDELMDGFRQFAHKEGYTQKQYAGAIDFQLDAIAKMVEIDEAQKAADTETEETRKQEIRDAFKQKWGGEVAFQNKIRDARILADKLGIYQTLEAKGLASDPEIINMLDIIESRTAEDTIVSDAPTTMTKTAQQRIDEIKKSEAFLKRFHPDHKEVMKEYMNLNQEVANAGQARQPRI